MGDPSLSSPQASMPEMLARWVAICALPLFFGGCALFDQPPPEPPKSGRAPAVSTFTPLGELCRCGVSSAERELRAALASLEAGTTQTREAEGFATCASALTGVPTLVSPILAASVTTRTSFAELDRMAEQRDLSWELWIAPHGEPMLPVNVRPKNAKHGDLHGHVHALKLELGGRVEPVGRALKDAHLAAQLCHATALFVALEARARKDRSHTAVLRETANSARIGDGVAAAATGLVLELRRAGKKRGAGDLASRLARFRALGFDGEFDSDADDVERVAARYARVASSAGTPEPYSNDVALPLWLAPRPALGELCQTAKPSEADAARTGLSGLRGGDLDRMMLGARSLYPHESSAHQGRTAFCELVKGDDRRSLAAAREMVPGYSATGILLASMSKELP